MKSKTVKPSRAPACCKALAGSCGQSSPKPPPSHRQKSSATLLGSTQLQLHTEPGLCGSQTAFYLGITKNTTIQSCTQIHLLLLLYIGQWTATGTPWGSYKRISTDGCLSHLEKLTCSHPAEEWAHLLWTHAEEQGKGTQPSTAEDGKETLCPGTVLPVCKALSSEIKKILYLSIRLEAWSLKNITEWKKIQEEKESYWGKKWFQWL